MTTGEEKLDLKRNAVFTVVPVLGLVFILAYGVTAAPGHGYISVPAPAFHPESYTCQYDITSLWVRSLDDASHYYAPLELPQGATATRPVFFWKDGSTASGYCSLWRGGMTGSYGSGMASAYTSGDAGEAHSSEVTNIFAATVDNSQHGYGLTAYLPDSGVEAFGAIV